MQTGPAGFKGLVVQLKHLLDGGCWWPYPSLRCKVPTTRQPRHLENKVKKGALQKCWDRGGQLQQSHVERRNLVLKPGSGEVKTRGHWKSLGCSQNYGPLLVIDYLAPNI